MRGAALVTLCLILLAPGVPAAEEAAETPGLHVGVSVSSLFGDTMYEMNARAEDPTDPEELVDIRSRLEFPLDVTLLGVTVSWEPGMATSRRWAVAAGVHTSVTDPSRKMTDEDWVDSKQLAYTESDGDLSLILATTDVSYRLRDGERTAVSLLFHLDYQRMEQQLVGFEGWRGSLFSDQQWPVAGTAPVIDYDVTYVSGQLGAGATYLVGGHSRLGARATVGVAYASDTDDHLLRGRIAEGKCWGVGLNSRLEFELLPGFTPLGWLSASLVGELRFFHTEGQVDQRWYRDEDLPEGTVIADLPYELESLQLEIRASIGGAF